MTDGLILLGFIALLIAFGVHRFRRRLGLSVTLGMWATVIALVAIVVLIAWANQVHH